MNYDFPTISHIDDVLPYIKDASEFIVVDKEDYTVVNYVVMNDDTFPIIKGNNFCPGCKEYKTQIDNCGSQRCPDFIDTAAIRRECRGLIFDKQGKLINRRFHKFFNVNERDETRHEAIDWSKPHHILEKLDGSMVSPCKINGHIRWMTKMGITDTSMEAEVFVAKNPRYMDMVKVQLGIGWTPIFEWCSNKNRIVLDYPEDKLVFIACRNNETGEYTRYDGLVNLGKMFGIPVAKAYSYDSNNILEIIRQQEDTEGVVVRFNDGHMVKVKSDWYVRIHKIKSALSNERELVSMILNDKLDDLIPVLPDEDVKKINQFKNKLIPKTFELARTLAILVESNRHERDRKTFAIECAANFSPLWRGLIFKFWEDSVEEAWTHEAIRGTILKHCGSNQAYQKVKTEFLKDIDYA